jgi:hypothetical protein
VHVNVADPEPFTLVGENVPQVSPEDVLTLKTTDPVNPLTEATVIVEVGDCPTLIPRGDVTVMVKSWKRRTVMVEWIREPLDPVTVSV